MGRYNGNFFDWLVKLFVSYIDRFESYNMYLCSHENMCVGLADCHVFNTEGYLSQIVDKY